jgi:hypothetical protein
MNPKKSNPYPELDTLRSDQVDLVSNYHGQYDNKTTKKYIIYSCLGEATRNDQIENMLKRYQHCRVAIVTTRDYPEEFSQTYDCKFFKIPSAYAYYTTEMPQVPVNFDRTFEKLLLSLNNRAAWPRQALYQFMLKFNLLDRCYFSYLMQDRFGVNDSKTIYNTLNDTIGNGERWYNLDLDMEQAYQKLPYKIDNFVNNDWGPGNIEYYEKSFCSFVNETYINENYNVFFTEKTMKPLAYGHPMLLFSSAGALAELKKLGFETYSSIFDESYDSVDVPQLRFELLLKQLLDLFNQSQETLALMYTKIKPVLEHNHNYFWNGIHQQYLNDVAHVREQISDYFNHNT